MQCSFKTRPLILAISTALLPFGLANAEETLQPIAGTQASQNQQAPPAPAQNQQAPSAPAQNQQAPSTPTQNQQAAPAQAEMMPACCDGGWGGVGTGSGAP
ncbi:MAG: hypothetical protein ABIT83_11065, partial [Massilia sp.]